MEYYDVDVYAREVTTASPEAQLWFNRGLVWCFAYFHDEAVACFRNALIADPSCAMAFWGVAYATGPNYNLPWEFRDETMRRETRLRSLTMPPRRRWRWPTPRRRRSAR